MLFSGPHPFTLYGVAFLMSTKSMTVYGKAIMLKHDCGDAVGYGQNCLVLCFKDLVSNVL